MGGYGGTLATARISTAEDHRQLAGQGDRASLAVPQLAILLHQPVDEHAGRNVPSSQPGAGRPRTCTVSSIVGTQPAATDPRRVGGKASAKATADSALGCVPSSKADPPGDLQGVPLPRPAPRAVGRQAEVEAVHDFGDRAAGLPGEVSQADALVRRGNVGRAGAHPGRSLALGEVTEGAEDPHPLAVALDDLGHDRDERPARLDDLGADETGPSAGGER